MAGRYKGRFWVGAMLVGVLSVYLILDSKLVTGEDSYTPYERSLTEFGKAYRLLATDYFKVLEPEDLSKAAIGGMLEDLDPYTSFFDRRALAQLRIETQGKFGGLGITISRRTVRHRGAIVEVPVVMSVIEETPADTAGLTVGDRIVEIEGEPTFGKTLSDVVDVLRGDEGAGVTITIARPGRPNPFHQPIIRARIPIQSVRVPGEMDAGIGYISMSELHQSRFTEKTGKELETALRDLQDRGAKGIVLDLRGNPGGLLTAAVAVADKFLEPDRLVVSTKGRAPSQNREHRTEGQALVPNVPLVVLVNGRSASASEIVAGAIQDWDRGLILGTQTFGKGSVQTVRQIGHEKALKLTTAVYYTPSERSIHSANKRMHRGGSLELTVNDSIRVPVYQLVNMIGRADRREDVLTELNERFELSPEQASEVMETRLDRLIGLGIKEETPGPKGSDPKQAFKTHGGRTVFGGGGITPDMVVERERRPRLVLEAYSKGLFFGFAVQYAFGRTFPTRYEAFELPPDIVDRFRAFMADTTNTLGYVYQTAASIRLLNLKQALEEVGGMTEEEEGALEQLRTLVDRERDADFGKAAPFIRYEIERQLATRVWGINGHILASLKGDKQYQEAVAVLKDPSAYKKKMKLQLAAGD